VEVLEAVAAVHQQQRVLGAFGASELTVLADGSVAVEPTMDAAHVGNAILHMANLPLEANIFTMTIKATKMPFEGRG
jgi:hypothetical protein